MNVFITSSPYLDGADRAILNPENQFIHQIRQALPPLPRALFVASDPEQHELTCSFGMDTTIAFAQAGITFSAYQVLDGTNAEDAGKLVAESDFIILAGGHVPTENAFFQEIGLRELLEDFDGTVMGISAGSMNLAEEVYVQPEEEGEGIDPDFARFAPGLGLTDVNILPHYQKVKDNILDGQRLFEDITYGDSFDNVFYALVDGSYIMVDDEGAELFGEAYVITDGQLYPVCDEEDSIPLE